MELIKKEIKYFDPIFRGRIIHDESADAIVPDSEPDIARIAGAVGNVYIKEKNVQNNRVLISGTIRTTVFYMPESDDKVHSVNIPINFAHIEDTQKVGTSGVPCISAELRSVEASAANPRKISVKAAIAFDTDIFEEKTLEITTDADSDASEGIELLREECSYFLPKSVSEKSFVLIDTIEMTDGGNTSEMIVSGCKAETSDIRVIAGKAAVKGKLNTKIIYKRENGDLLVKNHTFPFSQIVEMPGITEESTVECKYSVKSVDFEPDAESDGKYCDIRAAIDMFVLEARNETVPVLRDLYSTHGNLGCDTSDLSIYEKSVENPVHKEINDSIEVQNGVQSIIDSYACFGGYRYENSQTETVNSELYVNVLYTDGNGEYRSASKIIPITFEAINGNAGNVRLTVENISAEPEFNDKLSVKASVQCICGDSKGAQICFVTNVTELPADSSNKPDATLVLKYMTAGENLWNAAKKYGSTVADIEQANGLRCGEEISDGRLLVIPLKK